MDLKTNLQDYLSKSKKPSSNDGPENGRSYFNFLGKSNEPTAVDDTTNGWFNQAQKDPLLPGLVSRSKLLNNTSPTHAVSAVGKSNSAKKNPL